MATIVFQMTSAPLTGSSTVNGSDADMTDLLAWAKVVYAADIEELFNPSHTPSFVPTNAQIGRTIHLATVKAWSEAVTKWKRDASIAAIPPTVQPTWSQG